MNRRVFFASARRFATLGLLGLGVLGSAAATAGETVTLVADSWCPYNCDAKSPQPGFVVEIAKQAFGKHGIEVNYTVMPWARAIDSVRSNKYTAIVGASREDAPDFVFPSVEQGWMVNSFYVRKGNPWRYKGVESLGEISLGAAADYAYGEPLDSYIKQRKGEMMRVQLISGDDPLGINLKKLQAGRVGAVIEDKHVMDYYLASKGLKDSVDKAGELPLGEQSAVYIAFSPQNNFSRRYADILAKETDSMRKSGELAAILQKYQVADWK